MKTKFVSTLIAALLLPLNFTANAQSADPKITVGELVVGNSYDDEGIERIIGTKPSFLQETDGDTIYRFYYEGNAFYTSNGALYCFELSNEKLKLNNIVGVGDTIDKAEQLGLVINDGQDGGAGMIYYQAFAIDDNRQTNPFMFVVKDNVIFRITYLRHGGYE